MKILILNTVYEPYLNNFYKKNSNVNNILFKDHKEQMLNDFLTWPTVLANYMNNKGYNVEVIIDNAEILQKTWANENNLKIINGLKWRETIVLGQIKKYKPDLLLILNPEVRHYVYINDAKSDYKKLAFFLGHDISNKKLIKQADILFTSSKEYVYNEFPEIENLYQIGVFFPSKVLNKIAHTKKIYDIVFVGNITHQHKRRAEILAYLVKNDVDLKIFSSLAKIDFISKVRHIISSIIRRKGIRKILTTVRDLIVPSDFSRNISVLSKVCLSPIYGIDYYKCLSSAKINLNIHIDMTTKFSGNNRMYDVTGVGSCLITDKKITNNNLFEINKEIIEFNSKEDLLKILEGAKSDNYSKVEEIAKRGQEKTLSNYSESATFAKLELILNLDE